MQPMDINDTNAPNESITLGTLENPLYLDDTNDIENPIYSNDIGQESIYTKPIVNTTMSYIKSINDDLSLVNYWNNLSNSAASGLSTVAAEEARKAREELADTYRVLTSDFARQGAVESVNRSITQFQAVTADINNPQPSTYLDVKESAQKASESLLAVQEISQKTGRSPEEVVSFAKQFSKNLAIRAALETSVNSMQERGMGMQLFQDVIGLQAGEDIAFLLPAINKSLEDWGFTESVLTAATAKNAIQKFLNDLPEQDAVQFIYDLKDKLVDAVDEKDARRFMSTLLQERATTGDVVMEVAFNALDLTALYSIVKGTVRGGIKMVSPSKAAVVTGNTDAAAADVARTIAKNEASILGHPEPLTEASALNPNVLPNGYHQLNRKVQENLRQAYEQVLKALATAVPTSGATKADLYRTADTLKTRFDPLVNKGVRRFDVIPDDNLMRVRQFVEYDNYGTVFKTAEDAKKEWGGKLSGSVEYVEVTQDSEQVIKTLKADLKRQIADLEKEGIELVSKGAAKPVKPVSNIDDVPVSKQSRVENLNDVIQTSKTETGAIASLISKAEKIAKVPKVLKTSKPRFNEFSIQFSSVLDKALYITRGEAFAKRAMAGNATAVDKEILSWVNTVTDGMTPKQRKALRDDILKQVKNTKSVNGVISIPAVSKLNISPMSDALKQKWLNLRKTVKDAKLADTTDGAKLASALDTPVEEAAKDFQTALAAVEAQVKPRIKAKEITPEIQSKLLTLEETSRMLEEAKAGRYLPKGWVVRQRYDHPVFTDNNLAKLSDKELNATHGAFLSFFNPALGAAESFYDLRLTEVMKQSKYGKAWVDYFKKMPSLSRLEKKKVTEAIVKTDKLEREFEPLEVAAELGLDSEKAVEAYYLYRQARNILHMIKDREAVDDLVARGFREAKVSVPGADGTTTIESFVVKQITDATPVFDKRAFNMTTGKSVSIDPESLANGAQVLEVRGGYLSGRTNYRYIIVEPTKVRVHDITSVVGKKAGTFSRIYTDEFFIVERFAVTDDVVKEGQRALRTATTLEEADKYVAGMKTLQEMARNGVTLTTDDVAKHLKDFEDDLQSVANDFNSGKYSDVTFERNMSNSKDAFMRNVIYRGGYDVTTGKLFFSGRGNKAIPSISQKSIEANVADPWTSIQKEITNTINFVSATEMRRNMIQKWYNTFKDLIPADMLGKDAEQTFATMANGLDKFTQTRTYATTREKQMVQQLKVVMNSIGVEHPVERMTRMALFKVMNGVASGVEKGTKLSNMPVIKNVPAFIRQFDPVNFARAVTSHAFLGLFSPRQIWVQSSGMLYTTALHPIHGAKAAFNIKPLLTAYSSDNPEVWKWAARTADTKDAGAKPNEFIRTVAAMKRIGLLDNIGASTVNEVSDASVNLMGKASRTASDISYFWFNSGEAINRVGAFDTARRVWSAQNKGLEWDSTENLPKVLALADTFTGNMTRASEAVWQKGVLSIPTQFLQYGVKSSANIAAAALATATGRKMKGLTSKEMAGLLLTGPMIYGLDNTGVEWAYKDWLGEQLAERSDEEKLYVGQGIIAGIIDTASQKLTGQPLRLAIGTMTSPFTFSRDLTDAALDGTFDLSALGGPFTSLLEGVYNIPKHAIVLYNKDSVTAEDVATTVAQMSADTTQIGRAFWRSYVMYQNDGMLFDAQKQLIDIQSMNEVVAKGLGFTLNSEATKSALFKSEKEYKNSMKSVADKVKFLKKKIYELQPNDPMVAELQKQIDVIMNTHYPADRREIMKYIKQSPDYRTETERYILERMGTPSSRTPPSQLPGINVKQAPAIENEQ